MNENKKYDEVIAFIPKYKEDIGNCTEIIREKEENYITQKPVNTCLKNIADHYCVNLKANRKVYGKVLGIKNKVPIALSDKHVFIFFKARKPIFKNDGANGYIDINYIKEIYQDKEKVFIELTDGRKIKAEQDLSTMRKNYTYGKIVKMERR
ncbi:MAG: competence protein ComK [Bacillota bacterium]|nr:competence protein ComK [Bacillota bacterium]